MIPFLFGSGTAPTIVAACPVLALFAVGAATSIFTVATPAAPGCAWR